MKTKSYEFLLLFLFVPCVTLTALFFSIKTLVTIAVFLLIFAMGWLTTLLLCKNFAESSCRKLLKEIFVIAFFARMCFLFGLFFLNYTFNTPIFQANYNGLFADDLTYHQKSIEIAAVITHEGYRKGYELAAVYYPVNVGYGYATAILYHLFSDSNTFIVRTINCIFGSLIAVLSFLIAYSVYVNIKIAKYTGVLTALFPISIVLASVQYKDIIAVFLFLMLILVLLNLFEHFTLKNLSIVILGLSILITMRIAMASVIVITSVICYFSHKGLRQSSLLLVIALCLLLPVIAYFYRIEDLLHFYSFSFFGEIAKRMTNTYIATVPDHNSVAFLLSTNHSVVLLLLFNVVLFLIGPLPSSHLGIFTAALPGVWLWYLLLPAVIGGIGYSVKNKIKHSWFLILLCMMVFLMTVFSFNGSNFRYREQIMPLLLMFASVCIVRLKSIKAFYPLYLSVLGLSALLYFCFKYA